MFLWSGETYGFSQKTGVAVFPNWLEHLTSSLPVSSSCSLLSAVTRGVGLNYVGRGWLWRWCRTWQRCLLGQARAGHDLVPVASSWDNKSLNAPSAAAALPESRARGQRFLWVYVWGKFLGPTLMHWLFRKMGQSSSRAFDKMTNLNYKL